VFVPESVLPARRAFVAFVTFALALAALTPLAAPRPTRAATTVFINEFHYDNDGIDVGEFVEIAAPAGTNLTGWSIVLYNGGTGQTYDTDPLSGTIPNHQNGFGTFALSYPSNGIQNGTVDAIALVQGTTVVQFLGYEGSFVATNGPAVGLTSTDIGVAEGGTAPIGTSLSLQGTGTTYEDFVWATGVDDTPGAVNTGQSFSVDPVPVVICGSGIVTTAGTPATATVTATDTTGRVVDLAITSVTPAEPNITIGATTTAAATGGTASATVTVGAATAAGSYAVEITATNDDATTQTGTCVLNVTVNEVCGSPFTSISSIQGSGATAALTGLRTTEGVVVGDFEGTAANSGFFMQDPVGDGDAATSDGIFVFTGSANAVDAGDYVRVTGFARERFNQTALNGTNSNTSPVTDIVKCGTGTVATTDVEMPFASSTDLERFEGMKVRFPQSLVIAEYFNYGRFGEMVLALPLPGETRPFTGTAIDEPGAAANARTLANSLRRITLDDNQSAQNPPVLRHPNGLNFSLTNRFRGGDHVQNTVGVLGFDFSLYRIFPTGPADYSATNVRPTSPEPVGGSLRVAAMNTLNFFLTLDETPSDTGVSGPCGGNANLDCRGADANADPADDPIVDQELPRQRDKLLQALAGLDADVLGLNELENTPGVDPLADIVAGLNAMDGVGPYAAIDTGPIGTDAIKVGLIYNPEAVLPVGGFQVLSSVDDPRFIDTKSRPALAQTFEEIATGARFTVVVNHLKSKGSDCLDVDLDPGPAFDADNDTGDGQGNCNGTRTLAAQALVDWIATDPTGSGDPDFLIMGDLNSYAMEDPIDAIRAGADDASGTADDWTNLIALHQGTYAYSYVFDGQNGYLDHALANASITGQVAGAADWHINADEPSVLDYDVSFKPEAQDRLYEADRYRTSDHDPVVVGLDLINDPPTIEVSAGISCSTTANGGSFALTVDDNEQDVGDLVLSIEGNTNPALVSNANVVFGGSGADRSVAITATSKQSGTAVLTIGVGDGWNTTTVTITVRVGTDANESFSGTAGADLLVGAAGNDSLAGFGGADVLCGGQGIDTASGGEGNDAVEGGQGDDVLSGGAGTDVLRGGQGDDSLAGGAGADAFSGGPGSDTNTDFSAGDGDTSDGT